MHYFYSSSSVPCCWAERAHALCACVGRGRAGAGGRGPVPQVRGGVCVVLPQRELYSVCGIPARQDRQRLGVEGGCDRRLPGCYE